MRGYLEDKIVSLKFKLKDLDKSKQFIDEFGKFILNGCIIDPGFSKDELSSLFFQNLHYDKIDLDTLDVSQLLDLLDHLSNALKERYFFKEIPDQKVHVEDSLKLLRLIEKSKRAGHLSFEIHR
jgi:hypothetical protein